MCPPKACGIDEIDAFVTNEQIIACLESIQNRSPEVSLPRNVVTDINPYLQEPANLSEVIWYVVHSEDPKQTELGSWKAKGDPCQLWSESSVVGWRTTLEFYEGRSPDENRTDWVMQEYSISHKGSDKEKACTSLCRVFLSDSEVETQNMDQHQANDDAGGQNNLIHDELNKSDMALISKVQEEEMERYQAMPSHQGGNLLQADCAEDGDYLELLDLLDPLSSSSSSETSSCVSCASDVCFAGDDRFDPAALLQELECEDEVCQTNPVSLPTEGTPIEPDKVEGPDPVLTLKRQLHGKDQIPENSKKPRPPPVSDDAGASSSRQKSGSDRGKKVVRGKMFKKFFCFIAF